MHFNKSKPAPGANMMQSYMERRLTDLHYKSGPSVQNYKDKVIAFVIGTVIIALLPYLHIGIFYLKIWVPGKPKVDRKKCRCSCFDTVFRGEYEDPGQVTYKHVYFNATWETSRIWIFTVIFMLLAYESIKYLIPLIREKKLRKSMFVLYLVNLYPHYYSWWSYFSYYNEDFYRYYYHHLYFTVTELIATCMVLHLCDNRNKIVSWKIFVILGINSMHMIVAGIDQFVTHVIVGRSAKFQSARDIGLMVPDLLHIIIPVIELVLMAKNESLTISELCYKEEVLLCVLFIFMGTVFGRIL